MSVAANPQSNRDKQSAIDPTASTRTNYSGMSAPAVERRVDWGRYALRGLATVVTAALANTVFYYLAAALGIYDPEFIVLANVIGIVIFTAVPAIVAVLLYAALLRFARRPAGIFKVISAIVFVVTLIPDFTYIPTVPGSSNAQTAVLVLMHIIAAVVIVRMLTGTPHGDAR